MKQKDIGKTVIHTQEPEMGKGRVLAVHIAADRVLVKWDSGIIRTHFLKVIKVVGK